MFPVEELEDVYFEGAVATGKGISYQVRGVLQSALCNPKCKQSTRRKERACAEIDVWFGFGYGGGIKIKGIGINMMWKAFGVEGKGLGCTDWNGCGAPISCDLTIGVTVSLAVNNSFTAKTIMGYGVSGQTRAAAGVGCHFTLGGCGGLAMKDYWCDYYWEIDISATLCKKYKIFGMTFCRTFALVQEGETGRITP